MLTFSVYLNGVAARQLDLSGAYLVGTDDVPLRADISLHDGVLTCRKRAAGPAGLVLPWSIPGQGQFMLETARLMERPRPYILQLELARGRLIRLFQKVEEWGLADLDKSGEFTTQQAAARQLLLNGMLAESEREAAECGDQAIAAVVRLSEVMTATYSRMAFERRRGQQPSPRLWLGVTVLPGEDGTFAAPPTDSVDFLSVALPWRVLEPQPQKPLLKPVDDFFTAMAGRKVPICAGPLIDLTASGTPAWLSRSEGDFEGLRDMAHDHIKRVVSRYAPRVGSWIVTSGLNAGTSLPLTFEQVMELTRMSAALVKRLAPSAQVLVEIDAPWGEYYAENLRTIPPNLFAEMVTQGGVAVDGFCLNMRRNSRLRDFFQIAALLDRFGAYGKPLHVTGLEVPCAATEGWTKKYGYWNRPWDETVQAEYLRRFVEVALGKPVVESVTYGVLDDQPSTADPLLGLRGPRGVVRPAYRTWGQLRGTDGAVARSS